MNLKTPLNTGAFTQQAQIILLNVALHYGECRYFGCLLKVRMLLHFWPFFFVNLSLTNKFMEDNAGVWQKQTDFKRCLVLMFVKRTSVNKSHIFKGEPSSILASILAFDVELRGQTHTRWRSVCYTRTLQFDEWEFDIISCCWWVISASNIQSLKHL